MWNSITLALELSKGFCDKGKCPGCRKCPYKRKFIPMLVTAEGFLREIWPLGIREQRTLFLGTDILSELQEMSRNWLRAQSLCPVWLFETPWIVSCQAPLSMVFSRQEYWSGLPFPSPGHLHDPRMEPGSPALAGIFLFFFNHWTTWSRNYLGWKLACVKAMKDERAWSVEWTEGYLGSWTVYLIYGALQAVWSGYQELG